MKILFVCTQNVFRSMSAHYLALKYIKENNLENYQINSAGTIANSYEVPYMKTLEKLSEFGIININHKNQKLTKELISNSDIIICMTKSHQKFIKENFNSDSILFNYLALKKDIDLEDDVEVNYFTSLDEFIDKTIEHINSAIPNIFTNISNSKIN